MEKKKISVLLIGQYPLLRQGLRALIDTQTDMYCVGETIPDSKIFDTVRKFKPLVTILLTEDMNDLVFLSDLKLLQEDQRTKIILFTSIPQKILLPSVTHAGYVGIFDSKTPKLSDFIKCIKVVARGSLWLSQEILQLLASNFIVTQSSNASTDRKRLTLSAREKQIACLVAQDYKNKEMAERLFISEQTIKNHLHNISDKLGVSGRTSIALYAINAQWVPSVNRPIMPANLAPLPSVQENNGDTTIN